MFFINFNLPRSNLWVLCWVFYYEKSIYGTWKVSNYRIELETATHTGTVTIAEIEMTLNSSKKFTLVGKNSLTVAVNRSSQFESLLGHAYSTVEGDF